MVATAVPTMLAVRAEAVGFGGGGGVAHVRDFPDEFNAVFGFGVIDLSAVGHALAGGAPPAFGQEIVEEQGVVADHPELAAGAGGVAIDIIHAKNTHGVQVFGEVGGLEGHGEAITLPFQVGLPSRAFDVFFVLRGAGEEFKVHEGVGRASRRSGRRPVHARQQCAGPGSGP